ncbi:MAG: glucosaminidase domain-containing protein, partial [Syntrophaceticus sp.]
MKKTLKILLVVLFTILSFLNTNVQSNAYAQQNLTPIMGQSQATKEQAFQLLRKNNSAKTDEYIQEFVNITWEEAAIEGVRADVAFSLMMLETGWLKFGGDVKEEQNNFGGLGATGGGNPGHSFPDIPTGIRAVVQHLKAYASTEPLKQTRVDPRFNYVTRGSAIYVEWLGQKENPEGYGWATGFGYGYKIINIMNQLSEKPLIPVITNLTVTCSNSTYSITATASYTSQPLY